MDVAKLSIQLYTLREASKDNFEQVLKFCSEQGFQGVEFAGFYGHSKEEIKSWLDKYHLTVTSAHVPLEELEHDLQQTMEFHRFIGNHRIVCPFYLVTDQASLRELIEKLTPIAKTLTENGFDLYYHNHDHELAKMEDQYILDCLCDEIPQLKLEVDTFWVYAAKQNPVEFLQSHKDRIDDIVHIKDGFDGRNCTQEQHDHLPNEAFNRMQRGIYMCPCSIGLGNAPIKDVIETCKQMEIEWFILENDFPYPDGYTDVARSIHTLKEFIK